MWGIIHICSTNSELNFTLQNMINNSLEKNFVFEYFTASGFYDLWYRPNMLSFIQRLKLSNDMHFGADADIYMMQLWCL